MVAYVAVGITLVIYWKVSKSGVDVFSIEYLPLLNKADGVLLKKAQEPAVTSAQVNAVFPVISKINEYFPIFLFNHKYTLLNAAESKNSPVLNVKPYCSSIAFIIKVALIAGFKSSGNTRTWKYPFQT